MSSIYFLHDLRKFIVVGSAVTSIGFQVVELATEPRKISPDVVEYAAPRVKNESGIKVYGDIQTQNSPYINGVNVYNLF